MPSDDWIKDGDDTFWNLGIEENPQKNKKHDPCPDGWRIPTAFEMSSLVDYAAREWTERNGLRGYLLSAKPEDKDSDFSLFLPAGGRINVSDGKAYDRNTEAYYWTISGSSGNSSYLYFFSNNLSINKQGSRAGGCLLRCIKE